MNTNEFDKCITIIKKLREEIRGTIFIAIENDTVTLHIHKGRSRYKRNIRYLLDSVDDANYIVPRLVYDYKEYINDSFLC